MDNNYQILSEVIHRCTRCKSDLNHRVLELHQGTPKRVLCLTCLTSRAFRPKPLSARRAALGKAATAKAALESKWRRKLLENREEAKTYAMDGIYQVNDVINHAVFGLGLTTELITPGKMRIFFEDGLKLLKCGT